MAEVAVIARARAAEGKDEEMLAALQEVLAPSRAEEGCLSYTLHRGLEDRRLFATYERWRGPADFQQHMTTPHVQALLGKLGDLVEGAPEIVLYDLQ